MPDEVVGHGLSRLAPDSAADVATLPCCASTTAAEDADPADLAPRLAGLANALRDRFARSGEAGDLDAAIEARRKVLAITPAGDPHRWQEEANLGTNLRERYLLIQHAADIEESVASYETALREVGRYSPDRRWAVVTGLSAALRTRFVFRHQRADIERAIALYEAQLAELGPGLPARDGCLVNLANALWDRSRTFGTKDDARRAMGLYQAVLGSPLATPEFAIRTAGNLIVVATELQAWPEVAQASPGRPGRDRPAPPDPADPRAQGDVAAQRQEAVVLGRLRPDPDGPSGGGPGGPRNRPRPAAERNI